MFMMSSRQSHCESSPSSSDECTTAPSGCQPSEQANQLGLWLGLQRKTKKLVQLFTPSASTNISKITVFGKHLATCQKWYKFDCWLRRWWSQCGYMFVVVISNRCSNWQQWTAIYDESTCAQFDGRCYWAWVCSGVYTQTPSSGITSCLSYKWVIMKVFLVVGWVLLCRYYLHCM